ncbi:hypothetical protein [Maliponia aquimaris]|uniref:hypothetical protein n=1 Tax=Maliponia aquimaris TaxID=1673631 RepID=UPI001140478E|nr:hypothetical protein [Maliponia aquimaris]
MPKAALVKVLSGPPWEFSAAWLFCEFWEFCEFCEFCEFWEFWLFWELYGPETGMASSCFAAKCREAPHAGQSLSDGQANH